MVQQADSPVLSLGSSSLEHEHQEETVRNHTGQLSRGEIATDLWKLFSSSLIANSSGFNPLLPQFLNLASSKFKTYFMVLKKNCENSNIQIQVFSWMLVSKLVELFKRLQLLEGIVPI